MCGYDPFYVYDAMLEREYLDRMAQEEEEFVKALKNKTDYELGQLLREAEELQSGEMKKVVLEEVYRRHE